MKSTILIWVIAVLITLASAIYQRMTGPTYPLRGEVELNGKSFDYKLIRTHGGKTNAVVDIEVDGNFNATLFWKRFKTDDEFVPVPMKFEADKLIAELPNQPPAGKLEYYIEIDNTKIPADQNVIRRFKGDVPIWILIPHVIAMFGAMLLATRTGLEYFRKGKDNHLKLTYWTLGFLIIGGFLLGPAVQYYAFDAWWTGFPFGTDLTDNKTLIALIVWLIALFMYGKSKKPKAWALIAAIVMMIVYLIPHSMLGSELDYNKIDNNKIKMNTSNTE